MASTEEALVSTIEADAACQTHLGSSPATRFYPSVLPQAPVLPAAVWTRIAGAPVQSFDGLDTLDNAMVQIDCWAETLDAARDLAGAMRAAIDAASGLGAHFQRFWTDFEDKPRLYRVSMDVSLWVVET